MLACLRACVLACLRCLRACVLALCAYMMCVRCNERTCCATTNHTPLATASTRSLCSPPSARRPLLRSAPHTLRSRQVSVFSDVIGVKMDVSPCATEASVPIDVTEKKIGIDFPIASIKAGTQGWRCKSRAVH